METQKFYRGDLSAPMLLDDKGRCCGRKPLIYKRDAHRYCVRCDRAYSLHTDRQVDNWAWKQRADGQFEYSSGAIRTDALLAQQERRMNKCSHD